MPSLFRVINSWMENDEDLLGGALSSLPLRAEELQLYETLVMSGSPEGESKALLLSVRLPKANSPHGFLEILPIRSTKLIQPLDKRTPYL